VERTVISATYQPETYQYLYGNTGNPFQITASKDKSGNLSTYYYDGAGLLFAIERSGERYYVATDQVGTPKVVTDPDGNTVKVLEYDSYGNLLSDSNPSFYLPIGFAGGLEDRNTGLVRFGMRDYDQVTGRWTARDPILFEGGQGNLYVYVGNNPVNYIDPLGLKDWFLQVEADLSGIYGGEVGVGIVLDTDNLWESGVFGTAGPAVGPNVGIAAGGGVAIRDIEGCSFNIDVNAGEVSPTFGFDDQGFNSLAISGGLGIGISASETKTWSYTVGDAVQDFKELTDQTLDWLRSPIKW